MAGDPKSLTDKRNENALPQRRKPRHVNPWVPAGVMVAVVGVVVALIGLVRADEPAIHDNHGPVIVGNEGTVTIEQVHQRANVVAGQDDAKFKDELAAAPGAGNPPAAPGPWPFAVVDSGTDGLLARDNNIAKASPVGHAANRAMIWVDCVTTTDFTPPTVTGDNNVGPQWASIRWRHLDLPTDRGISDPFQPQTAWMYLGGLVPIGHNGQVPRCDV